MPEAHMRSQHGGASLRRSGEPLWSGLAVSARRRRTVMANLLVGRGWTAIAYDVDGDLRDDRL